MPIIEHINTPDNAGSPAASPAHIERLPHEDFLAYQTRIQREKYRRQYGLGENSSLPPPCGTNGPMLTDSEKVEVLAKALMHVLRSLPTVERDITHALDQCGLVVVGGRVK